MEGGRPVRKLLVQVNITSQASVPAGLLPLEVSLDMPRSRWVRVGRRD